VHANTVRYRLRRAVGVCGYDVTDPRDAHVVRMALALGRLSVAPPRVLPAPALVPGVPAAGSGVATPVL
jgi:hypothetical protein